MPDDRALPSRLAAQATRLDSPCGDGVMVWRAWGHGPPIVLLHGGHGSWEHWIRNIGPLSARRRVIAGDLPGLGDSDPAPPPHDAPGIGAIVAAGIRRIVPEGPVEIAGFSLGSVIAAHAAHALGDRVTRLVLLGPAGLAGAWGDDRAGVRPRPYGASHAEQREVVRHNLGVCMIADPARVDDLAVDVQTRLTSRRRGLIGLPISSSRALLDVLPERAARTQVIVGEHDPYLRPDVATCLARLQADHPGLSALMVRGAGHWVAYEAADRVNAALASDAAG